MELRQVLDAAIDDEFKARATYRRILEHYGPVRPFVNIVESEQRHIAALETLYSRYGLPVPEDPWPGRVELPASLGDACCAAVLGERENAALYDRLIGAVDAYPDVQRTLRNLRAASQDNHLPAFERCVERESQGGSGRRGEERGCGGGGGRGHRRRRGM
jgi:hypothetical protein